MPKILYFCPDFLQPSGGIKTLYRHVCRLRESGFDAWIVHQRSGFRLTWHEYEAPLLHLEDRPRMDADDIWVMPEVMVDLARKSATVPATRVVIALSWASAYHRLKPGEAWQDLGIHHILAKSPVVQRYLSWAMDAEVTLIPEFVDPQLYHFAPNLKKPKVAYATRKDASGEHLRGFLFRKGAPFTEFEWTALRELDEAVYAQHLREASVYLATTVQEAKHVSVLEAMACGCLVVGFTGIGGAEYMVGDGAAQNCVWVDNGDLPSLGRTLEQVLCELAADPACYDVVRSSALAAATAYQDAEAERRALTNFFTDLMQN